MTEYEQEERGWKRKLKDGTLLTGVSTTEELKRRMLLFLEYMTERELAATSIAMLNRRYHGIAKKLGTTPLTLVYELDDEGAVTLETAAHGGVLVMWGKPEFESLSPLARNADCKLKYSPPTNG